MKIQYKTALFPLLIGLSLWILSSCEDYLSVVPKGEKIPVTLNDFALMLKDEYSAQRVDALQALILLNDRHVSSSSLNYYPLYKAHYNWDEDADRIELNKSDEQAYYVGYGAIAVFNLIIQSAPEATEATEKERRQVIAQAKVLRAITYFNLINYYSDSYEASTADQKGGVPLITSANVNAPYTQPSVQEVYDFILRDMEEAYADLPESSETILHPNRSAADAFYARIYLQMGNYADALTHANRALDGKDDLFDWTAFYETHQSVIEEPENYNTLLPSPMGFQYVESYQFRHGSSSYQSSESSIPVERWQLFEEGDARAAARWKLYSVGPESYYRSSLTGFYNYGGITTVEVYLIKAECLARSGDYDDAMELVNRVRQTRILPAIYQPLTASSVDEAMQAIISLKGNELILTQVPFMDARRWNAEGKYLITRSKELENKTLTLSPTSHLWTMPFPQGAVENAGNGSVTQNVTK